MNRSIFAALLLGALPAGAQVPDSTAGADSAQRIAPVVVEGRRSAPIMIGGASAILADPDSLPLPAAAVLEQALREIPFVLVRQNSRGEAELSLRGGEARQVAILLDGVPLSLGWDHRGDPSVVPLTGARSLLVVRGLSSVLQGPNVLGGSVEVAVAGGEGSAPLGTPIVGSMSVDHVGARSLAVTGGSARRVDGRVSPLSWRAGIALRDAEGVALSGDVNDAGSDDDLRANSDAQSIDGFAALRLERARGGWAGVTVSAYETERGVPPELHLAEPRFWRYQNRSRFLTIVSGGTGRQRTPWGRGSLTASVGVQSARSLIDEYSDREFAFVTGQDRGVEQVVTGRIAGEHALRRGARLSAAATAADIRFDEGLPGSELRYNQRLASVGAELLSPLYGLNQLAAGMVADFSNTPRTGDKPLREPFGAWGGRFGATRALPALGGRAHIAWSHRARFPSLRELYSGALGRFVPNPSLRAERQAAVEAGLTARSRSIEWQAVAFQHRLQHAIVRTSLGDGQFRRENRDEIRASGLELLAGWSSRRISLESDIVVQRIRVRSGDTESRAEHQPEVRGDAEAVFPLMFGGRANLAVRHTGRQYCVSPETDREMALSASTRADVGVERTWSLGHVRSLRAVVALDNVTDAAIYDQCGLPQPGRTLRFTLNVRSR